MSIVKTTGEVSVAKAFAKKLQEEIDAHAIAIVETDTCLAHHVGDLTLRDDYEQCTLPRGHEGARHVSARLRWSGFCMAINSSDGKLCVLQPGHVGPHDNGIDRAWNDSDKPAVVMSTENMIDDLVEALGGDNANALASVVPASVPEQCASFYRRDNNGRVEICNCVLRFGHATPHIGIYDGETRRW